MAAYALAQLRSVDFNEEIAGYLRRIDETLVPFEGRFLVHGKQPRWWTASSPASSSSSRSRISPGRMRGTPRTPTRPSCRCAPVTPTAERSSSTASRRGTRRPDTWRRCSRARPGAETKGRDRLLGSERVVEADRALPWALLRGGLHGQGREAGQLTLWLRVPVREDEVALQVQSHQLGQVAKAVAVRAFVPVGRVDSEAEERGPGVRARFQRGRQV